MKSGSRAKLGDDSARVDSEVETSLFSAFNRLVEPAVRAGFGSLWLSQVGLIVLETTGRKTGLPRRVPLLATMAAGHIVVSTLRVRQSRWLRNVLQTPDVRYWLRGQELHARAVVVMSGHDDAKVVDDGTRCLVNALRLPAAASGAAFVILLNIRDRWREN